MRVADALPWLQAKRTNQRAVMLCPFVTCRAFPLMPVFPGPIWLRTGAADPAVTPRTEFRDCFRRDLPADDGGFGPAQRDHHATPDHPPGDVGRPMPLT